jgi:large subunit ribosomal protein L1
MGKVRTKVFETAIEPEKVEKIEKAKENLPARPAGWPAGRQGPETAPAKIDVEGKKKKTRPPKKRSSHYKELLNLLDKSKLYPVEEAVELIKKMANATFDPTVEAHINLGLSAEKSEHQIRVNITLPHPITPKASASKPIKILVFTDKNKEEIKKLGVEIGTDETLKEIEKGKIEFSKIIADPSWMPKLAKVAKILGPKGLMPNPKAGTISEDPAAAVKEFSGGRMELRMEKSPIIHISIGKASLDNQKIKENLVALISAIRAAKPEGFKKELIKSIYLSSSMGPSVKVDPSTLQA